MEDEEKKIEERPYLFFETKEKRKTKQRDYEDKLQKEEQARKEEQEKKNKQLTYKEVKAIKDDGEFFLRHLAWEERQKKPTGSAGSAQRSSQLRRSP